MEYITKETAIQPFMMLPQFLLDMKLPSSALIVYVLLLDRIRLSMKNEGWEDEEGRVFVVYTIEHLAKNANKDEKTIKKALNILEQHDLIVRVHCGLGRPNHIFLKIPEESNAKKQGVRGKKGLERGGENVLPQRTEIPFPEGRKRISKHNYRTKIIEPYNKAVRKAYGKYKNVMLTEAEYDKLNVNDFALRAKIEEFSEYMYETGKDYPDHAAVLKKWKRRQQNNNAFPDYSCSEEDSL